MNCSACGSVIQDGAKFCAVCGTPVIREIFCTNCGNKLTAEQKFCPQCGAAMAGGATANMGMTDKASEKKESKFKSNVVTKALKDVPGNVISEEVAEDIAKIISMHALGAAASGAATAWIPGAGATVATAGQIAFIWSMYVRISDRVGINLSKKKLKFLGSAIVSNLASAAGSYLAATAISLIPGVGSVAAVLLMAGAGYALVTVAGIIYINLMSSLIKTGADMTAMSDEELKAKMTEIMKEQNIKGMMKDAQTEYVKARKAGTVSGKETVELEEEE